ncbi:MAG: cytochrome c [Gammaproteobacteria bacterium]|nr:cytochrome c [Gammaproteobacteria bacterium]
MMRILKALGTFVLVVAIAGVAVIWGLFPRVRPAADLQVLSTPEVIARGEYLVNEVLLCFDCHSERDWTKYSGPAIPPLGAGRPCMDKDTKPVGINFGMGGFPGKLCIRNITPDVETGIGGWTDGEVARAIREGVSRDGEALFPIMPWFMYTGMSDEDVAAVIAYLRAQPPVKSFRPARELDFPLNVIFRFYPRPLDGPVPPVPPEDTVAYGKYLTKIARCEFCHTARVRGRLEPLPGRLLSGGVPFFMGKEMHYSKNLTPHPTGLGGWTREMFIGRFRLHTEPFPVVEERNSEMNWVEFSGISDADLGAIWDYLRSVPPLETKLLDRAD